MPELAIDLCGGFRCRWRGRDLPAPPRRDIARLLVYLSLEGRGGVTRRRLAEELWPDSKPELARATLRTILHGARHYVPDDEGPCIAPDGDAVALAAGVTLRSDLLDFIGLAQATRERPEGWPEREPFIERCLEVGLVDWPDPWLVPWRDRFDEAGLALLETHGRWQAAEGRRAAAQAMAHRLLVRRPADEPAHRLLMRLHAASGDLAGLRRQFEDCRRAVEDEFGAAPSARTVELARALIAAGAATAGGTRAEVAGRGAGAPPPVPEVPFVDMTGRADGLSAALERLPILTVVGPAGSGKTRLIRQVLDARWGPSAPSLDLDGGSGAELEARLAGAFEAAGPGGAPLFIDHAEEAGAGLAQLLRRSPPGRRVVVASRRPMGWIGERCWPVPPLGRDMAGSGPDGAGAAADEPLALFTAALGSAALTGRGQGGLRERGGRWEGRPLALLAAASWLSAQPGGIEAATVSLLADIAPILDWPLGGARHASLAQSLAADRAWLTPAAMALLARLAGAADPAAAIPGADLAPAEMDALGGLVRCGLVAAEARGGAPAFRLPPLVRGYWSRPARP